MTADLVLCCAPVMSAVRPSPALGLLQAACKARGIPVRSLYLNLLFADHIGLDLNEAMTEALPTQLLAGDWLFAPELPAPPARAAAGLHRAQLEEALRRKGLEALEAVRRIGAGPFLDQAAALILRERPRVVGFTTMFEQTAASLALADRVKRASPSTAVVFGGANCHGPMGAVLLSRYRQIDYVFTGEADLDFAPFVEQLLARPDRPASARGCIGRCSGPGPPATPVLDLDALPVPDYGDYFEQLAWLTEGDRVRPAIPFESSRGCWWGQKHHCTFCGLNPTGMTYRAKSPARVTAEIEALAEAHGVRRFAATDNILSLDHVKGVLSPLAERSDPARPWRLFYEIKANMDEGELAALAGAGATLVQPGIESLCDPVLRLMKKGVGAITNIRLMRNARELNLGIAWAILYGFPGEPPEEYARLAARLPLLEHLQPPSSCQRIRLDRFSPNYERAGEIGFEAVTPMPAYGAIFDVPDEALADLAYFFEGHAPRAARDEHLEPLKAAVAAWKARWMGEAPPPQLVMVEVGPGLLVKDSRSCAVEPFTFAAGAARAVLDLLRAPLARATVPLRLQPRFDPAETQGALDELVERGLVIDLEGVVMTLAVTGGREVFDAADRADLPHGYLAPADAASAPVPRPAHAAAEARP